MKSLSLIGLVVVLALWVGYSLGYRQGVKNEERAWSSTAQMEKSDKSDLKIVYRNPHIGIFVASSPRKAPVNVPDPRIYRQYEDSRP